MYVQFKNSYVRRNRTSILIFCFQYWQKRERETGTGPWNQGSGRYVRSRWQRRISGTRLKVFSKVWHTIQLPLSIFQRIFQKKAKKVNCLDHNLGIIKSFLVSSGPFMFRSSTSRCLYNGCNLLTSKIGRICQTTKTSRNTLNVVSSELYWR